MPGVGGLRRKDFAEKVKLKLRITEIEGEEELASLIRGRKSCQTQAKYLQAAADGSGVRW